MHDTLRLTPTGPKKFTAVIAKRCLSIVSCFLFASFLPSAPINIIVIPLVQVFSFLFDLQAPWRGSHSQLLLRRNQRNPAGASAEAPGVIPLMATNKL